MPSRFRRPDWLATPLGEPTSWPSSLLRAVRFIRGLGDPAAVVWGPDCACLHNDAAAEALAAGGYPDLLGRPVWQAWPALWQRAGSRFASILAGRGAPWHEDVPMAAVRDGRLRETWWRFTLSPVFDPLAPSGVGGVLVLGAEVTREVGERDASRQRATAAEQRTALALEALDAGVFEIDLARGEHRWDRRMRHLLGVLPDVEPSLESWLACMHPQDRERAVRALDDLATDPSHDGAWQLQVRVRRLGGGWRWLEARGRATWSGSAGASAGRRAARLAGVAFDATERVESAQAVAASAQRMREGEERLRLAMESSRMGYWDLDVEAESVVLSEGAQRTLDLPGHELVSIAELLARIDAADRDRVETVLRRALDPAGSGGFRHQHRVRQRDGSVRWVDAAARTWFALVDGRQRAVRNVCVLWDITETREAELERERLAREVEQALETLREVDRRKDEYLAMLAHELRNPLAPITNAHRVLERSAGLSGPERGMLSMAQRQTGQLTRLVDDLLDVSRVSRGKIELRLAPVRLADAIHEAAEAIGHEIARRGQALAVRQDDPALVVRADPARLRQILGNLLANACKYTPDQGRIALDVEDRGAEVEIRVTDSGIGIAPEKIPMLFELFQQIDAPLDRAAGGLGLGLAMVRQLAALHGGSVRADSPGPGLGATFTVRLPKAGPAG